MNPWVRIAFAYLYTFRVVAIGAASLAALIGWIANIDWLVAAAVCIGIGEALESSYYITVMRWGSRYLTSPAPPTR
jgi:hypothetical protein